MNPRLFVLAFVCFGGGLLAFLLVFQNTVREGSPLVARDARTIYLERCAACHGDSGEGRDELGRPLRGRALPAAFIKEIVKNGRNKMPAQPDIPADALDTLARYVNEMP